MAVPCCSQPPVGTIVHYVSADQFDETCMPCLPAIVTDHCGTADVELTVINHGEMFVAQARHDHEIEARTWHSADPAACDGFPY